MGNNTLATRVLINIAVKVFFGQGKAKKGQKYLESAAMVMCG